MTLYIDTVNRIKEQASMKWLTPSQLSVYDKVLSFLMPPFRVINVYGQEGVGKTFLGRILDKQGIAKYITSIGDVNDGEGTYVADNCDYRRGYVRNLRNLIHEKHLERVIILTKYPAEDSIPRLELNLTSDDIQVFKANLFRIDVKLPSMQSDNLWHLLRSLEV